MIWKLKEQVDTVTKQSLNRFSPLLQQLFFSRSLATNEKAEQFLTVEYAGMYDPFIFRDMTKTVERIWQAIESQANIVIYADYDADAVTASATMIRAFEYLGVEVVYYIPDRFKEGYGLNLQAFHQLADEGAELIITVDCGTNSVKEAELCKELGIDLIITDHHEITGEVPQSYALINPKNPEDPRYPDHQITGVGVAFKVVQALFKDEDRVRKRRESMGEKYVPGFEKWLLDLVSIGTVADCHSLAGENRIIVHYGLKVLEKTKWPGLRSLLKLMDAKPPFTTRTLGFSIAPKINAAGRLKHASLALDLLLEDDPAQSYQLACELDKVNKDRQELTSRMVSEANEMIVHIKDRPVLLLHSESWHKGVVGLVAGRLLEQEQKPVIILEKGETESTGSMRTPAYFDAIEALKSGAEHLVKFGGHKTAAGLTVKTEKVEDFYQALITYANMLTGVPEEPVLELDAKLTDKDITFENAQQVSLLEPFGVGNPEPLFWIENAKLEKVRAVGEEGKHLQVSFSLGGQVYAGIAFFKGKLAQGLQEGILVDIAANMKVEVWNGRETIKFFIKEINAL